MAKSLFNAGSFNLKGKKEHRAACGCCTVLNFKDKELKKEHEKEMKELVG